MIPLDILPGTQIYCTNSSSNLDIKTGKIYTFQRWLGVVASDPPASWDKPLYVLETDGSCRAYNFVVVDDLVGENPMMPTPATASQNDRIQCIHDFRDGGQFIKEGSIYTLENFVTAADPCVPNRLGYLYVRQICGYGPIEASRFCVAQKPTMWDKLLQEYP